MAETVSFDSLSAVFKKQVINLRKPVAELAKALGAVRTKTKDLAPEVMGVYGKLTGEYPGLSFVDFARLIDGTIPTFAADRDGATGYRNHPTYYALTYMRRIAQTEGNREGRAAGGAGGNRGGGVRDSATDALARSLKTILQIVKEPEAVWGAVQSEFGFTERLMNRLRKRVEETKPLFTLPTKAVQIGSVIKMAPKPAATAEPANLSREGGARKRSAA